MFPTWTLVLRIALTSCHWLFPVVFAAPDFRAYLIGGLMAFLLLVVSLLCVYNSFKIDIVLWYRSTFYAAQPPEGEYVWSLRK